MPKINPNIKLNENEYLDTLDSVEETSGNFHDALDEGQKGAEGVSSGISAADFDPERVLYEINKSLLGFAKRDGEWVRISEPLMRTDFINLYINSLRSLVNYHSMFSQTTAEESAFNMLESLKEITYAAVDYGVQEEHIETLINIYDTMKATFYGIIINGRGTENIKQVLTSVYKDITAMQMANASSDQFINWQNIQKYVK